MSIRKLIYFFSRFIIEVAANCAEHLLHCHYNLTTRFWGPCRVGVPKQLNLVGKHACVLNSWKHQAYYHGDESQFGQVKDEEGERE